MDEVMLKKIADEIELKYDCKVISIHIVKLISLCVMVKIKFNQDVYLKPFEDFKPESICFSDRTVTFFRRVDLFDCTTKNCHLN
jgi:hypothetical protein